MGKLKKGRTRGSILLDLVVALLIAGSTFVVTLGGIALAARTARLAKDQTLQLIAARNEKAAALETVFSGETSEEE